MRVGEEVCEKKWFFAEGLSGQVFFHSGDEAGVSTAATAHDPGTHTDTIGDDLREFCRLHRVVGQIVRANHRIAGVWLAHQRTLYISS